MTDYQTMPPPAEGVPTPQQAPAGYGYAPPQVVVVEKKRNGLATAAMVLGILALIFCWIPFLNAISYFLAVVAIGLGIAGLVKASKAKVGLGMAIAGLLMGLGSIFGATVVNVAAVDSAVEVMTTESDQVKVTFGDTDTTALGTTTVEVTVKNQSDSEESPMVTVAAVSPDGKVQYDTATIYVEDLQPGQSATDTAHFTEDIPSDAEFVVTDVI